MDAIALQMPLRVMGKGVRTAHCLQIYNMKKAHSGPNIHAYWSIAGESCDTIAAKNGPPVALQMSRNSPLNLQCTHHCMHWSCTGNPHHTLYGDKDNPF
jgi:hypothetical protein